MSKRTQGLERRKNDFYETPWDAVRPLLPHLPRQCRFIEPCAGAGKLIDHLEAVGHKCIAAFDIAPQRADIRQRSCHQVRVRNRPANTFYITNPPYRREIMHPIIRHLANQLPTWLIFEMDWLATQQAIPFLPYCHKVVAVGRVRWIEGTTMDGMENFMWAMFDASYTTPYVEFYGKQP